MKYSSRFFLYAPMGVFLALVVIVSVHWWIAASRLSAWLDAANGHEIVPGVTMTYGTRHISGFPFSLDTAFRDVTFSVATPHGPTKWHTAEFAMHALTYGRNETIFEAAGPQTLTWTRDDGTRHSLPFAVGALHVSTIVEKGALANFDLDLLGFGSKAFTAKRLQFHMRRNGEDKLDLFVTAEGIGTSPETCPLLGAPLAKGELIGAITQARALSTFLAGGQGWNEAVASWRAAGGRLGIDVLYLSYPAARAQRVTELRMALPRMPAEELATVAGLNQALCDEAH